MLPANNQHYIFEIKGLKIVIMLHVYSISVTFKGIKLVLILVTQRDVFTTLLSSYSFKDRIIAS